MSSWVLILAFVSFVIIAVKGVETIKRPNRRRQVRMMLAYLVFAIFLYGAPYLTIFVFKLGVSVEWVSAHAFELHLAVVVFFLLMFLLVCLWLRAEEKVDDPEVVEGFKEEISDLTDRVDQLDEDLEGMESPDEEIVKDVKEKFGKIMDKIEEMDDSLEKIEKKFQESEGGDKRTGASVVAKESSSGGGHKSGRDNRNESRGRGADGGKGWKELAEEYNWKELAEEYKKRREAEGSPEELIEVLRALEEKGCKFGSNKQEGGDYLQIRKYENNKREAKGAGPIDDDVEKALDMAEIRV